MSQIPFRVQLEPDNGILFFRGVVIGCAIGAALWAALILWAVLIVRAAS